MAALSVTRKKPISRLDSIVRDSSRKPWAPIAGWAIALWILVGIAALAYFSMLLANTCFFAAGPDSSGYCNEAKLLARRQVRVVVEPMRQFNLDPSSIYAFTPLAFSRGTIAYTMVPTYPAGLPLHLVTAAAIGGWKTAPFLVVPIVAMLCLGMIYLVARELGLSRLWSIAAVLVLAAFPVFIEQAIQAVSDDLATFYALLAVWCALRARRKPAMAVATGVAFAAGVWVRPTNLLLIVPLSFALRWRWTMLLMAAEGALPIGIALGWFNTELYGRPWRTGYGMVAEAFSLQAPCFGMHARAVASLLTPLVLPCGLLAVFDRYRQRFDRALLATWFLVFFGLYACYRYCPDESSTRFLLPGVPGVILGLLCTMSDAWKWAAARGWPRVSSAVAVILIVAIVVNGWENTVQLRVLDHQKNDSVYPESVRWAEKSLPNDALVFAGLLSGAFLYYSGRVTVRWDQIGRGDRLQKLRDSPAGVLPWYAVLSDVECSGECLRRIIPGAWTAIGRNRDITLWRYDAR
jgi:hypothetical protein